MKNTRLVMLILFLFVFSGCFSQSYITSINKNSERPETSENKITSLENVSGSSSYALTAASGFRVKQSAGMITNKQLVSTQNGYRVYLHVTGRTTSGESE